MEIPGICLTINTIDLCTDIPDCITAEEIRLAILDGENLGMLLEHVLCGWSLTKAWVWKQLQPYWSLQEKIAIIDAITMKGKGKIVPASLQNKVLNQLPLNHMGIEKHITHSWIHLLVENEHQHRKNNLKLLHMPWFQATEPKDQTVSQENKMRNLHFRLQKIHGKVV